MEGESCLRRSSEPVFRVILRASPGKLACNLILLGCEGCAHDCICADCESGCDAGGSESSDKRLANSANILYASACLLPNFDRGCVGSAFWQSRKNGDRMGADIRNCLHVRSYQSKRGCSNGNEDRFCIGFDRLAPTERSIGGAPRRQSIDLGSHNAMHKFGSAIGQFERPEKKSIRLQYQFYMAAGERSASAAALL